MFDCSELESIAKRFGTPLYYTDFSFIREQFAEMNRSFSELGEEAKKVRMFYSLKANSNPFIVKYLSSLGANLEILSEGELAVADLCKISPKDFLLGGTMIPDFLFRKAAKLGIMVNLDSIESISRAAKCGLKRAGIRVNPLVEAGHHDKVKTATKRSKFGIGLDEYENARKEFSKYGMKLDGIDYHIGSGIGNSTPFIEALSQVCNAIEDLPNLEYIDIGGGYASVSGEPFDFSPIVDSLRRKAGFLPKQVFVESGRYLVANSTVLLTRVTEVKHGSGRAFVGVDAGFNDMMRTVLYGAEHEIFTCGGTGKSFRADLVGPICESGDIFRTNVPIDAKEGSLVALCDVGAYGYSLTSNYLVRPKACEIGKYRGEIFVMREREEISDLISNIDQMKLDSMFRKSHTKISSSKK